MTLDVTWNEGVFEAVVTQTAHEALRIVADRIVEDAKPLTRTLSTKPPGPREWYYSMPAERLRASIRAETFTDAEGPGAEIYADTPLARFQGFGGHPAYGGSRAHNNAMDQALALQQNRPIP